MSEDHDVDAVVRFGEACETFSKNLKENISERRLALLDEYRKMIERGAEPAALEHAEHLLAEFTDINRRAEDLDNNMAGVVLTMAGISAEGQERFFAERRSRGASGGDGRA